MDIPPETTGLGLEAVALIAFVRLVMYIGKMQGTVEKFLDKLSDTLDAQKSHYVREEKHQETMEELQKRQLAMLEILPKTVAVPRPVLANDHTPVVSAPR